MKHIITLLLLFIMQVGNAQSQIMLDNSSDSDGFSVETIKSDTVAYIANISIHRLEENHVNIGNIEFSQLSILGGNSLHSIGAPQLPTISRLIAIPTGASYTVDMEELEWKELEVGKIYPAQEEVKESLPLPEFELCSDIYQSFEYSPTMLWTSSEQVWHNIRSINISVCPFRYFPTSNKLNVLTSFKLVVKFANTDTPSVIDHEDLEYANRLSLFDNDISMFPTMINSPRKARANSDSSSKYDYLIIIGDLPEIQNSRALKDFCRWKAFKGYKTKVVTVKAAGKNPEGIKKFILKQYGGYGVRYVLFIGDHTKVPLKEIVLQVDSNEKDTVRSDYWYGDIIETEEGYTAELPIGRFPTNSLYEFQNMVNKTIDYEKSFSGDYAKALLVAHRELAPGKYQKCCEGIKNRSYMTPLTFYTAYGASKKNGGEDATNTDVRNLINSGMHIVNYRGHGEPTHWGINSKHDSLFWNASLQLFESYEAYRVTKPSIYFNVCCETGKIYNNGCMMQTFMGASKGAIACLAATEKIYTSYADEFNKQLYLYLLCPIYEYHIGDLNTSAHLSTILHAHDTNGQFYEKRKAAYNAYSFICGGDPSLEIWTDTPKTFENVSLTYNGDYATVTALYGSHNVSIVSASGELIEKGESPGYYVFKIPNEPFYIVLNKHNYFPYIIDKTASSRRVPQYDSSQSGTAVDNQDAPTTMQEPYKVISKDKVEIRKGKNVKATTTFKY